jgi:nucleoside-diphosphate-sugar epimerase
MANVLVIGGTGFLSSTLVAACLSAGHHVSIVTRGRSHQAPPDGVEALVANRSDPDALRTALDGRTFDIVLDSILYRPEDAHSAVDLFRGGRTGRYVFISTDFVYGGEPRTFPLNEDAPRHASGNYGRNKALCEDVFFDAWERERFPAVILRPPHILGVGGLLGTGSLEGRDPWLLWKLRNGWPIPLLDGGALLIQPVHKNDIARACLAVCQTDKTLGRAYNLAGPDCVTSRHYYEIVAEVAGAPPPVVRSLPANAFLAAFPERAPFAQSRCYALERIAHDAGFAPSVRLRDALAEVVAALDAAGLPDGPQPSEQPLSPLLGLLERHAREAEEALRAAATK